MNWFERASRAAVAISAAMLLSVACKTEAPPSKHVALDARSASLRAKFNQDADKVRVLMLVAPT